LEEFMAEFVGAQTSVPDWLMTYCRQLAEVYFERKLNRMYIGMLEGFLCYEPWAAKPPFAWRMAKIHAAGKVGGQRKGSDLGWVPLNLQLPKDLELRIKTMIAEVNAQGTELGRELSLRTFLYTAVCWWCQAIYPYPGPGVIKTQFCKRGLGGRWWHSA
jgi:hypothetical protein